MDGLINLGVLLAFITAAVLVIVVVAFALRGLKKSAPIEPRVDVIAERVRSVGKLLGLEVCAKEIATVTKGWSWMPPLVLSQARLAMIFHFEKQYFVDLSAIGKESVREVEPGKYRLRMPAVQGTLHLTDVTPYDIQDGRILGLLDVIQMNAQTQNQLMKQAQEQAAALFSSNEARYVAETRSAVERQLTALLGLFDVEVEIEWPGMRVEQPSLQVVGVAEQLLSGAA